MSALSSRAGVPEAVDRRQRRQGTAPETPARTPAQQRVVRTARASSASTTPSPAPSQAASSAGGSRSRKRSKPPATPPVRYEAPKLVSKRVKSEIRQIKGKAAARANERIVVAPKLKTDVKVTNRATLVAPKVVAKAVKGHPQAKQEAQRVQAKVGQRVQPRKPSLRESHRATHRERQNLKERLAKAAKRGTSLLEKLDRGYSPDETIKPRHAALLAEAQGLPGKTYRQIAKGESGFRPGVPNPDDATPSLWQMTPSVQSSETVKAWDKIAAKHPGGYTNPVAAAEQAKYLAGDTTGVSNYFGTGFMTNPDAHLKGGPTAAQAKLTRSKPIPPALKEKATEVLGKQKAKKVIAKAREAESLPDVPEKLSGPEDGSRNVVRELVGSKVRGDHGVKNEGTVHSAEGDHYAPNGYAQDINSPTGNKAEGEPAYNQATLDKIVRNARKFGFKDVPDLKIGENYEGTAKGYRLQLLTNEGGTVNHIHVGVRWEGEGATSSATTSGGSYGGSTGTTFGTTSGTSRGQAGSRGSRKRRKRRHKPKLRVRALPKALDPADYAISTDRASYDARKIPVDLGLG